MVAHVQDVHDDMFGECSTCRSLSDCAESVCPCGSSFYMADLESHAIKYDHHPYLCEPGSYSNGYRKLKENLRQHRDHDAEGGESETLTALTSINFNLEDWKEVDCSKVFNQKKALNQHNQGVSIGRGVQLC